MALAATDALKGVLRTGTARRYPLADGRPAAGKTGTQQDNTNAWFVGFTPQLTTAVWVGDPNGYTPMVGVPRVHRRQRRPVQGGRYPTQIWKAFMDAALAAEPMLDWEPPPADARPPARLYLPGNECLARAVSTGGEVVGTVRPAARPRRRPGPAGFAPAQVPPPPPRPRPTPTQTTVPGRRRARRSRHPAVTRYVPIEGGTTVPPDVLDPRAPIPSTPLSSSVIKC